MTRRLLECVLIAAAVASPALAAEPLQKADLVLRGGRVVTVCERTPTAEAIAIRGDRIAAVGSHRQIETLIGERTRVIELDGKTAMPGFIEGHGHFVGLGQSMQTLDLTGAKSYGDVVRMVREQAAETPPGRWITGRGWHQDKWAAGPGRDAEGYPTHAPLSLATPNHPVVLTHASGHACLANARAMALARITPGTKDPPGGRILRNAAGRPTGVFRETAAGAIHAAHNRGAARRTPQQIRAEFDEALRLATEECLAHGVTSFQDAGASFGTIGRFRELAEAGRLKVRLWVMVNESNAALASRLADYRIVGAGENHLTVRAIKRFIDGALGAHGAWLLEPYDDLPTSTGNNVTPTRDLRLTAELAARHDFQLCVHAIGDRANREMLDIFEDVFCANPTKRDLRWRIEHAQHLDPADIPRFGELGVIASMQPVHCTSDAPYVVKRLGEQRSRQGAYAWRSLLKSGAVIGAGTDVPVERVDPIANFYSAVTRRLPDGTTFFPEQRMTRHEALHSQTLGAAYAAFEEDLKGSLEPGKLADVVVLSEDLLTVAEDRILDTRVLMTIVGGEVRYEPSAARDAGVGP